MRNVSAACALFFLATSFGLAKVVVFWQEGFPTILNSSSRTAIHRLLLDRRGVRLPALALLMSAVPLSWTQQVSQSVKVEVHVDQSQGQISPVWNYFGYDEPNYTYAPNGKKLLGEIAALGPVPAYVRVHNLLTTGDGSASLKWGSTNVYTENAAGKPVYNWTILDHIFDTFTAAGIKPLVEIGFMPQALSTHPEPYRHNFPQGTIFTGWAYPPKDYQKWSEVVFQLVRHLRERYGEAEVNTWLWEVWNEPDIGYWQGTPEEYFKLYDFGVDAVLRALPGARVGGPDSTGPANPKAAEFLRSFLDHCSHQRDYVSGKTGSPLHFISFHPKGSPTWQGDHVQMGIVHQLAAIEKGFQVVASFPEFRRTPIILGESDPEGCAACSARTNPQNAYRNGPLYAAYTAETLNDILFLASRERINFQGAVTWAFEFEGQPYFEGFRTLATNGVDKPVLNAFRMFGLLGGERVIATSSGAVPPDEVVRDGVRGKPDINVVATRKEHEVEILIWNYHDDDLPAAAAPVDLVIRDLPPKASRVLLEQFRIDSSHSNAFAAWKEMGSPQSPSGEQYEKLERAGQLQLLNSPAWIPVTQDSTRLQLSLPRQAISLVRLGWE
jgi:xylan 1,4-beta-xylosidase